MIVGRWPQKPPVGASIDPSLPAARGLVAFYPFNEGTGPVAYDGRRNLDLVATGFGTADPWSVGPRGRGVASSGGSRGLVATIPPSLRLGWPQTIACAVRFRAAGVQGSARVFGTQLNNNNATPSVGISFFITANGVNASITSGSTGTPLGSFDYAIGVDYVLGLTVTPTSWAYYVNGDLIHGGSGTFSAPAWTPTAQITAAGWPPIAQTPPVAPLYWCGWWAGEGAAWTADRHAAIGGDVDAIWGRLYRDPIGAGLAASITPGIVAVSPGAIPAGHAAPMTLSLTGFATDFTAGSAVSIQDSVTGTTSVTKGTWTALSATSATLGVSTGAGSGTFTVTVDGLVSPPIEVDAATLAASPTSAAAPGDYSLSLTGTHTLWTQEAPATLFSPSGYAGATLSGITVLSDTRADATLTLAGSSPGTLTITDASTGSTATMAVHASTSGSLHVAAPLMLQADSPAFGGQDSAWFAFRFKANSDAGINLAIGAKVLTFSTTPNSSNPVIYQPGPRTLQFRLFPTSGSSPFVVGVPVQIGVNYHVLLAWQDGSQVLYLNGLPYATASIAGGTYAYGKLRFGGDAGNILGTSTPQGMDHTVSDLAIGVGAVPTAAEALALAEGTTSPAQLAAPASGWWPLGGGTTGTNPVDADRTTAFGHLADFSGNGNVLTVASGDLTGATYAAAIPVGDPDPLLVTAIIDKTGKFVVFEAAGAAPINGAYPAATISAVDADPTAIRRMGAAVQVGPRVHWPQSGDLPLVMYPLQCGGVQALAIEDGGATATTSPSGITIAVNNAGTGGSGLTLGTPVLYAGVTGYAPTNGGGAGYNQPPVLTITDPGGSGTGALGYCVIDSGGRCVGVKITGGGSGYSNPTGTISGGGAGSGAKVSLSQVGGVVRDNAVMTAFGSGYHAPPSVTVGAPLTNTAGPAGNKSAKARANVYGADAASWGGTPGAIREVVPYVGGLLGCGQGYTTPPSVTIGAAPAGGTTATYDAVVSNYIAAVPVTNPGADYVKPPTFTITDAGATRAAVLRPIMSGAVAVTLDGTTSAGSATVTGISSTSSIRVGQSVEGTGIPAGTTVAAVASGTSVTLSANATASGAPSLRFADAFTYDAPASWLTATLGGSRNASTGAWTQGQPVGGLRAVAGAAIVNQAGQVETSVGGLLGFADTPTMLAGANSGAVPVSPNLANATNFAFKNKLHLARPSVIRGVGSLTLAADDTPVSWSKPTGPSSSGGCAIGWNLYKTGFGNQLDPMGDPAPYGVWTFCCDDPHVNQPDATAIVLSSAESANLVITPVMLSGPASPVTIPASNVTLSNGGLATISLTTPTDITGLLGTGWEGAGVRIGDGTGGGSATVVVAGGVPTKVNVVAGGSYSVAPSAVLYGTKVSGTTVTLQHDYEYAPTTAAGTGPTEWASWLTVEVSQPQGTWNLGNPWLVAPDLRTRGGATIPFDRSNPWALDDGVLASLTTPTGRAIGALRPMDANGTYGGLNNYVTEWDLLPDGSQLNWSTARNTTVNFGFARAFNTDPGGGTYSWSATKIYGVQSWAVQGPDAPGTGASKTITGTLTAGSALVGGVSDMGLLVGSTVSGTGVPAGARIAALNANFLASGSTSSASYTVHGDTGTLGLAAGMAVAGQFLPAGATIVSVDGPNRVTLSAAPELNGYLWITATGTTATGTGRFTLSAPATASGVQSLTVTSPGSIGLPADDMGDFLASLNINTSGGIELRSSVPHGLATGSVPNVYGKATVPFPGGFNFKLPSNGAPTDFNAYTAWVTGPYTIAICVSGLGGGQPAGHTQTLASTSEVAVNDWQLLLTQPPGAHCTSYEAEAERCKQLGCGLWLSLPKAASDSCMKAIAAKVAAHAGPDIPIHLEFGNELFTFKDMKDYFAALYKLIAYLPAGTAVMGGTPEMVVPSSLATSAFPGVSSFHLAAGAALDAFEAGWTAAGGDAARLRRHASGQYTNPNLAWAGLQVAQRTGRRVDHTHSATYVSLDADAPIVQALAPAGSAFAAAGSLPADAVNALLSYQVNYSGQAWQDFRTDAANRHAFGQPIEPVQVGAVTSGGNLPLGTYYFYYTFTDQAGGYGIGNETTVGRSQSIQKVVGTNNSVVNVTMPFWPQWAQALNWYVGPNTAPGVCTFYQQVMRSQYTSTYPGGSTYPLSIAIPAGHNPPPPTNGAAAHTAAVPTHTYYEGSPQTQVPATVPMSNYLLHDLIQHPSMADAYRNYKVMQQRGDPTVADSGAVLACDFELYNPTQYPNMWFIAKGTSQMPGDGLGDAYAGDQTYTVSPNRFATIQGGYSPDGHAPDGHDHMQFGVSPMLAALRSWSDVASPSPVTPTPTPTTTPTIAWDTPAPISYGTALDDTQLDATASAGGSPVDGTFAYTPAAGVIPPAGTTTLSTLFTPTDTATYTSASASVLLEVDQATPTIDWPPITPIAVGTGLTAAQLDATAGIPGTFVYDPPFGTVLPLGTSTLTATFTPADSANYTPASATNTIQVITSPTPTPTATEYAFTDPDAARTVPLPAGLVIALAYTDPDAARIISPT